MHDGPWSGNKVICAKKSETALGDSSETAQVETESSETAQGLDVVWNIPGGAESLDNAQGKTEAYSLLGMESNFYTAVKYFLVLVGVFSVMHVARRFVSSKYQAFPE